MALHLKIKTPENEHVHIAGVLGITYTLCGLETAGDFGLGIDEAVETKEKIDCPHCARIVKFCKTIKLSEITYYLV